jgi:hypothetical protein
VKTDIVEADLPLLLSKEALKKADAIMNFNNDTVTMFGEVLKMISTSSGHYAISLTPNRNDNFMKSQLTLMSKRKITTKLQKNYTSSFATAQQKGGSN